MYSSEQIFNRFIGMSHLCKFKVTITDKSYWQSSLTTSPWICNSIIQYKPKNGELILKKVQLRVHMTPIKLNTYLQSQ